MEKLALEMDSHDAIVINYKGGDHMIFFLRHERELLDLIERPKHLQKKGGELQAYYCT
jgi:hypothetical protein